MRPAATAAGTIPPCAASGSRSPRSTPPSATSRATSRKIVAGLEQARALGCRLVAFPELAVTGYPPEDLLFKPAFIEANLRALAERRARPRAASPRSSASSTSATTSSTRRPCCTTARWPASTTSSTCPTTASSTRTATSRPGPRRRCSTLGETSLRRQHLRGHLVSDRADHAPGAGRRRAGRHHQRLAVPRRQGPPARADARHPRGRRRGVPGLRQPGRRPGRAGLRRRQPDRRRARRAGRPRRASSPRTSSSPTSTSTRSSARACTTRGAARRSSDAGRGADPGRRCRPLPRARPRRRCRRATVPCRCRRWPRSTQALVLGTRDYVRKNGFKHVVIGLSGGIDSSLVAAIAVDALGRENVIGVTMPSPLLVGRHARATPRRLAKNLGIDFLTLPIDAGLRGASSETLAAPFKGLKRGRDRGEHPGPHPRQPPDGAVATSSAGWC